MYNHNPMPSHDACQPFSPPRSKPLLHSCQRESFVALTFIFSYFIIIIDHRLSSLLTEIHFPFLSLSSPPSISYHNGIGRYSHLSGFGSGGVLLGPAPYSLPDGVDTLPKELKKRGYATHAGRYIHNRTCKD